MKKTIGILLISIIVLSTSVMPVFAAEPTFNMSVIADKVRGVSQTKEVVFTYSVSNFRDFGTADGREGINAIEAVLEYDDSVFEPIEINLTTEGNYNGIKTETSLGKKAIETRNSWSGLVYNPAEKHLVFESSRFVNTTESVLDITLKVKSDAPVGDTTVKLTQVKGSDEDIDIMVSDVETTINIIKASTGNDDIDSDPDNGFGGYIRIQPVTTVGEAKSLVPKITEIKGLDSSTLSDGDLVPTGAVGTDGTLVYTFIAVGDINADGKITATDLSQIKAFEVGLLTTLNDNQKRAADIKWDAKYTVTDRSQLKILIVRLGDPDITAWLGTGTPTCKPV